MCCQYGSGKVAGPAKLQASGTQTQASVVCSLWRVLAYALGTSSTQGSQRFSQVLVSSRGRSRRGTATEAVGCTRSSAGRGEGVGNEDTSAASMLTPPALSAATISACIQDAYALRIAQVTFLPIGEDANTAVYRLDADDGSPYFLKLRRGDFAEVAVAVPAFLRAQGVRQVLAPLPTSTQQLWARAQGFAWILYPFVADHNGFETALTAAQWVSLGQTLKAVHTAILPEVLRGKVPREDYSSRWRDCVVELDRQVATRTYDDPTAADLAAFWRVKRPEIHTLVTRAEQLGQTLQQRGGPFVLCHTDLHAGNVLVSAQEELTIVDWDNPLFAPKERDLMFIGGGVGAIWNTAAEEALFYAGYGATELDLVALAYFRYERIVADLAAYGTVIFGLQGSVDDRSHGLQQVIGQFLPHRVVAIAYNTYLQLR
jgi:spectinomycin phosphotransferase